MSSRKLTDKEFRELILLGFALGILWIFAARFLALDDPPLTDEKVHIIVGTSFVLIVVPLLFLDPRHSEANGELSGGFLRLFGIAILLYWIWVVPPHYFSSASVVWAFLIPATLVIGFIGLCVVSLRDRNRLLALRNATLKQWDNIHILLVRRAELLPVLLSLARSYMEHEAATLQRLVEANTFVRPEMAPADWIQADRAVTFALRAFFAVGERYPNLKGMDSYHSLHQEFVSTENQLATQRQSYNDAVERFNTLRDSVPQFLAAALFGFQAFPYFSAASQQQSSVAQASA